MPRHSAMSTTPAHGITHLIGVDGGGTGTRARLVRVDGAELAQGHGGPSGLALGIGAAWASIDEAVSRAFAEAGVPRPPNHEVGIGLGLAGVNNPHWAAHFTAVQPGFGAIVVETDAYTTLIGAHQGRPGAIVAIGTGSVGMALLPDGQRREVGGWGFPAGDEGSGAWIGLQAIQHIEQVIDGRRTPGAMARAVIDACGSTRDGVIGWITRADQTRYASLAPLVIAHARTDPMARGVLVEAGRLLGEIATALDPRGEWPMALCGGLSRPLRGHLPLALVLRCVEPLGDAASGALHLIASQVAGRRPTTCGTAAH